MDRYRIIANKRPDGVEEFYFQIEGVTRQSSYDRAYIVGFAEGYAKEKILVEEAS